MFIQAITLRPVSMEGITILRKHRFERNDDKTLFFDRLEPIITFISERLPKNTSPNSITLFGFLNRIFASLICSTSNNDRPPKFVIFIILIANLIADVSGKIDGMHAHRLFKSNAIGSFLDRGLDCLNESFYTYTLLFTLRATKDYLSILASIYFVFAQTFFPAFYGNMILKNSSLLKRIGMSEVKILLNFILLVSWLFGTEFWILSIFWRFRLFHIIFLLIIGGVTFVVIQIIRTVNTTRFAGEFHRKAYPCVISLALTSLLIHTAISDNLILYYFIGCFSFWVIFSEYLLSMMAKQEPHLIWIIISWLAFLVFVQLYEENKALVFLQMLCTCSYSLMYFGAVLTQISTELKIPIFLSD